MNHYLFNPFPSERERALQQQVALNLLNEATGIEAQRLGVNSFSGGNSLMGIAVPIKPIPIK